METVPEGHETPFKPCRSAYGNMVGPIDQNINEQQKLTGLVAGKDTLFRHFDYFNSIVRIFEQYRIFIGYGNVGLDNACPCRFAFGIQYGYALPILNFMDQISSQKLEPVYANKSKFSMRTHFKEWNSLLLSSKNISVSLKRDWKNCDLFYTFPPLRQYAYATAWAYVLLGTWVVANLSFQ